MKNILKNKLVRAGIIASTTVAAGSAHAAADVNLVAAVEGFKTFFTENSAIIGVAFLAMAFIAIGWKWLKGMSFS